MNREVSTNSLDIKQEEKEIDLVSVKIVPDDENEILVGNGNHEIVETNTDDISLQIKIEEDNDYFINDEQVPYSYFLSDSFDIKVETNKENWAKNSSPERTSHETATLTENESLLDIANLIVESDESRRNSFHFDSNRSVDKRIQTVEKPFKCRECGKCFVHKSKLDRHFNLYSGIKTFKCEEWWCMFR